MKFIFETFLTDTKSYFLQSFFVIILAASTNPFGGAPSSDAPADGSGAPNDLLSFLDVPKKNGETAVDPTNPFASALFDPSQSAGTGGVQQASAAGQGTGVEYFRIFLFFMMKPQEGMLKFL